MDSGRVAIVWASGWGGSAYMVSDRHALTAWHVVKDYVAEGRGTCEVRCLNQRRWEAAAIVWKDADLDLALLEITAPTWQPPSSEAPRWGRVLGHRPIGCSAVGFPDAQRLRDTEGHEWFRTEQVDGKIMPLTGLNVPSGKQRRFAIHIESSPPEQRDLWEGVSGAAVFAGDVLVAVTTTAPANFGPDRLCAVPLNLALEDGQLTAVLGNAELDLQLAPVPLIPGLEFPHREVAGRRFQTPASLLRPERRIVPFHGRGEELQRLESWCLEERAAVRLMVGNAGMGKTRLALRLCQRMEERGWVAGFLSSTARADAVAQIRELNERALLVIDYAETRFGLHSERVRHNLADLLMPLATDGGRLVKVLLLARSDGDWWQELQCHSPALQEMLEGEIPLRLSQVDEWPSDREAAFEDARRAFAEAQGLMLTGTPLAALNLTGAEFEAILHVHMAALDAVGTPDDRGPGSVARGDSSPLVGMLQREARYWVHSAAARGLHHQHRILWRCMAVATLFGARDEAQAAAVLARVPDLADSSAEARRDLARWHRDLYPAPEWLAPLQPDALGEQLIAEVMPELTTKGFRKRFRKLTAAQSEWALTILDRAAQTRPGLSSELRKVLSADIERLSPRAVTVAIQTGDPIGRDLADVIDQVQKVPQSLLKLADQLPERTVALRELAVVLAERHVALARSGGAKSEVALWLRRLSTRLGKVRRRVPALAAIQEAVDINRELVETDSEALRELATSLKVLSVRLAAVGRRSEALSPIEAAIGVYRQLAETEPATFLPELASCLNNYAIRQASPGHRDVALHSAWEAVRIRCELVQQQPEANVPELANSLNTLGLRLSAMGSRELALQATLAALRIREYLARDEPDAFRTALAVSLSNLSNCVAVLGGRSAALNAAVQSVRLRRELSAGRPDVFNGDLVVSLDALANAHAALGRRSAALEVAEEAVHIRRNLAKLNPDVSRPGLVIALRTFSDSLAALGHGPHALAVAAEAVSLCALQPLSTTPMFLPDIAMAYRVQAVRLGAVDRSGAGLNAIGYAQTVYEMLAREYPQRFAYNVTDARAVREWLHGHPGQSSYPPTDRRLVWPR